MRRDDLPCGFAAADELAATCGYRCSAAQLPWARAAGEVCPLTAALRDLRAELERHRDVVLAFQARFDAMLPQPPESALDGKPTVSDYDRRSST